MRLQANEQTIPRLQQLGTLLIVVTLTLSLGAFFIWRGAEEQRESLRRISQTVATQQQSRLQAELDSALSYIEFTRLRTETVLRIRLREQVDTALQIVQAIYDRESGQRRAEEVQRMIIEALRPVRFFDGRGYYFIDSMEGRFLLLPTAPRLEGQTILDNRDDRGHFIMRGLIDAARMPEGNGYSSYRWYLPDNPKVMSDKLAYVRSFAPYGWLIGAGDYTYHWEAQQQQEAIARLRSLRFGQSGYIGLIDREGRSLLSPSDAGLEGQKLLHLPASQGATVQRIIDTATHGGGLIHYEWPDGKNGQLLAKTALVKQIEPWGWVLVVTVQDDELQQALTNELNRQGALQQKHWTQLLPALLLALILGLSASYAFSRWSRRLFARYHADMLDKNRVIQESATLFRAVFDNAAIGIAQIATDGRFMQINQRYCDIIGYTSSEVTQPGFTYQSLSVPDDATLVNDSIRALMRGVINDHRTERRYHRKDGSVVWVSLAVHLVTDLRRKPQYFIVAAQDITERKAAEHRLRLAANVFAFAREGIMITQPDGTIVDTNDSFSRITGYSREEAIGSNPRILKSNTRTASDYAAMWDTLKRDGHWVGEIWNRHKDGSIYAELQTISAVKDGRGEVEYYVSLFSDITPMMAHRQQLERIAHYDALTNLPNRVLLADRLHQALANCQRRGTSVAVLYLDLDGFKYVNDQFGHEAGDKLLVLLAGRLNAALREGDTLARIGGDEFVAVLVDLKSERDCEPVLSRMLQAASGSMLVDGHSLQVSVSIGVTLYPRDAADADLLIRHADQAMYAAKQSGKNRYHWFDVQHDAELQNQREALNEIARAIEHDEFALYYQPKVNLRTREVVGAEALIRWRHAERGLLSPADFLHTTQDHPISVDLGEWVIANALSQIALWQSMGLDIGISVNIDAYHLQQPNFVEQLLRLCMAHPDVPPHRLQLEVLETTALDDMAHVERLMKACTALGITFALDDFGTGYSSLTYLRHLPARTLKIDQSFVRDMLEDANDLAIVEGVIGLAKAFGREVIAEGVESAPHGERLLQMGCELAQGYGIAQPMPAQEFPAWVERWNAS